VNKRNYHHWQPEELEFLAANYSSLPKAELANRLGVTVSAIISCAKKHGFAGDRALDWTQEEDRVLQRYYKGLTKDVLPYLPGRTINAVEYRIFVLGLQIRQRARIWDEAEIQLLQKLEGLPVTRISQRLDCLCEERGWSKRSRASICRKLRMLAGSAEADGCLSVRQLANLLHADNVFLRRWVDRHSKQLRPIVTDKGIYLKLTLLAKFVKRYPAEIAQFKPDLVWLIQLVTGDL
jgi:hypothetical protein